METPMKSDQQATDDLIRTGVSDHLALQKTNPKAINDGIDPMEAFDLPTADDTATSTGIHADTSPNEPATGSVKPDPHPNPEQSNVQPDTNQETSDPSAKPNIQVTSPEGTAVDEDAEDDPGEADAGVSVGVGKKKKKKRKPKSQRGLNAATGFEEFYADAPLTPEQYEEDKNLYDASYSFSERIESAIQRYSKKRNFDPLRKNLFDKYLAFGGIDTGPKPFSGGVDATTIENSNASEIAAMTATHFVPANTSDEEEFEVDFERCLKGFLSTRFMSVLNIDSDLLVRYYINVIRNFLNYLLFHGVCPEYDGQIEASRKLCDQGEDELGKIAQLKTMLPGSFNTACSAMFAGTMRDWVLPTSNEWMSETDRQSFSTGMTAAHAQDIIRFGFSSYGTDAQIKWLRDVTEVKVVLDGEISLEVTEFTLGRTVPDVSNLYTSYEGMETLPVLGKMLAKTWEGSGDLEEDLTEAEEAAMAGNFKPTEYYEFWVEDELLQKLFVGFKFKASVKKLECGVHYFDAVYELQPSFFMLLPNEMMRGWRQIEKEWLLPRPDAGAAEETIEDNDEGDDKESPGNQVSHKADPQALGQGLEEKEDTKQNE